jgi:hypothetical protein
MQLHSAACGFCLRCLQANGGEGDEEKCWQRQRQASGEPQPRHTQAKRGEEGRGSFRQRDNGWAIFAKIHSLERLLSLVRPLPAALVHFVALVEQQRFGAGGWRGNVGNK